MTQFNLDDYKYKKPSKLTKENILNIAKDAAEGVKTIQSQAGNISSGDISDLDISGIQW